MGRLKTIYDHRQEIKAITTRYGVVSIGVFGSTVRQQDHPDSDVDFLVEWPAPHTLFDRMDLAEELEALLGTHVDIVLAPRLHWTIRDRVLREATWL